MISPWKILGGAVIGVGAIAAAPFTGGGSLLGGATLLGSLAGGGAVAAAVGAGAVGAGAGAYMSKVEEDEQKKKDDKLSKLAEEAEKIETSLNELMSAFNNQQQYFNLIIAMTAIGMACANADGEIAEEERTHINEFISGVSAAKLPQEVKDRINALYEEPPRLKQAFDLVLAVNAKSFSVFDQIIDITIDADGHVHEKEIEFKNDWEQLKRIS
jgi:Skp family chaperone for outer membrane proteins